MSPPPCCTKCGAVLDPVTDQFKDGRWKKLCQKHRQPAAKSMAKRRETPVLASTTPAPKRPPKEGHQPLAPATKRPRKEDCQPLAPIVNDSTPLVAQDPLSLLLCTLSQLPARPLPPRPAPYTGPRILVHKDNLSSSLDIPSVPRAPVPATPTLSQQYSLYPVAGLTPSIHRSIFPSSQPPPLSQPISSLSPINDRVPMWDASQPQPDTEEEDECGIGPGIGLDDFVGAEKHLYNLPPKPPEMNFNDPDFLDQPALADGDIAYIAKFYTELAKVKMETCNTCNRCWFDLKVFQNECEVCRKERQHFSGLPDWVPLYGAANNMDPGLMPPELPTLIRTEEMLLARVHVFIEVRQYRGVQYKYRGHVCHFAVNSGRVFSRLPVLPQDLDILILKPPPVIGEDEDAINRQFRKDWKVRRHVVVQWLLHLKAHHPGYADIAIDEEAISSLPVDGYVDHLLPTVVEVSPASAPVQPYTTSPPSAQPTSSHHTSFTPTSPPPATANTPSALSWSNTSPVPTTPSSTDYVPSAQSAPTADDESDYGSDAFGDKSDDEVDDPANHPDISAIPDLAPDMTEFEALRARIQHPKQAFLSMNSLRQTPLAEFNNQEALLSLAFPSLFPNGLAEFVSPRLREVTYSNYIKCLMAYRDGRFARHSHFRYAVFNTFMRKQSMEKAGFFVRKADATNVTVDEIQEAFNGPQGGQQLTDTVVRWSASLKGTRAFWAREGKQLEAMVRQLGCPTLFVTFSAADYYWDDLLQFMLQYEQWKVATAAKRRRLAVDFVRDNPHIIAFWFQQRIELFKKHVLFPKYNIVDHWDRFEWQARGSTHSHGLYYCAETPNPDVELAPNSSVFTVKRFAKYWDRHISAIHPQSDPLALMDEGSTLSLPFSEMGYNNGELGSILTRCYEHVCTEQYCLRKDKVTKSMRCRFEAPWDLRDTPTFEKPVGKSYQRFLAVRNHARLNAYARILPLGWRANTDIQVCTSTAGVVQYMGVYVGKGEVQSASFKDVARGVLPFVKDTNSMTSFATKLMNSLVGERDYSAQEVCHLLMGSPLTHCSRTFVSVDCRPEQAQVVTFAFQNGAQPSEEPECDNINFKQGRSVLEKYRSRLPIDKSVSYIDFLLHFTHNKTPKRRIRAKARILNFMPRYSPVAEPEHFARVKLMLHHPFRDVGEVLTINGTTFDTFFSAYSYCQDHCSHTIEDSYGLPSLGVEEDDPNLEPPGDLEMDEFDELAGRQPGSQGVVVDKDGLGDRPVDCLYNWNSPQHNDMFSLSPLSYWKDVKSSYDGLGPGVANTDPNTLEPKQRLMYDVSINHYEAYLSGRNPPQQLLSLDGQGGTGKTYLIACITSALARMAADANQPNPLVRCAPTGVSAHLINGRTIHSQFTIPILPRNGQLEALTASARQQLQAVFQHVKYVIIDEKSMIGLSVLSWVHTRCGEAFPVKASFPFAGLNMILAGDFWQLPPVGRKALFNLSTKRTLVDDYGAKLYRKYFNKTVELDTIMRQVGDSQKPFRDALSRLRRGNSTQTDWALFMTRCRVALSAAEKTEFDTTVRLCAKRVDVALINHQCIRDFERPVLAVLAQHNNPIWANINAADAGNLDARIMLCIGASIMLLQNIWTEHGLVNGATGIIHNIVWDASVEDRRVQPPKALLVIINGYTGPALFTTEEGEKVIPVFPISPDFWDATTRTAGSRFQFPTCLAWAITIHKSQGMSLRSAVVKCDEDFVPGLLYVALSRVKTLEGLMFDQPMTFQRLKGKESSVSQHRQADYDRRKSHHITVTHTVF